MKIVSRLQPVSVAHQCYVKDVEWKKKISSENVNVSLQDRKTKLCRN